MENGYAYYGAMAVAYETALPTSKGMNQQDRWYKDEQCWNCDAPRRGQERRPRLLGRSRAR